MRRRVLKRIGRSLGTGIDWHWREAVACCWRGLLLKGGRTPGSAPGTTQKCAMSEKKDLRFAASPLGDKITFPSIVAESIVPGAASAMISMWENRGRRG